MNTTQSKPRGAGAFTILEVMISIGIFAMIITAIYATWMSIVKGSRAAQNAAAAVQRSRIAMNALEASFRSMQLFQSNPTNYLFAVDTSGEFAAVTMVTRLSPAIPGFGVHRGLGVSRITFSVQENEEGSADLIMTHAPILVDTNNPLTPAYSAVLARDVTEFLVQFFDRQTQQYEETLLTSNALPPKVMISIATGKKVGNSRTPEDIVVREVTVASLGVPAALQRAGGRPGAQPNPRQPNPNPNPLQPNPNPNPRQPNPLQPNPLQPNPQRPRF